MECISKPWWGSSGKLPEVLGKRNLSTIRGVSRPVATEFVF